MENKEFQSILDQELEKFIRRFGEFTDTESKKLTDIIFRYDTFSRKILRRLFNKISESNAGLGTFSLVTIIWEKT